MVEYIADNGTIITEAMIDQWAAEADTAYRDADVSITAVEGRPWEKSTTPMKPRTIRVPDSLWQLVEAGARRRHISVSAFAREALVKVLAATPQDAHQD